MSELGRIKVLLSSAEKISKEQDVDKLLVMLSDLTREVLGVDRCSLFLLDRERNELWTKVAHGVDEIRVPADRGIVGWVAQKGESLVVNDAYSDNRFNPEVDRETGYRTQNILAIPLFDKKGNILGVFQAVNKLKGSFSGEDVELFTLLGGYASSAIENSILQAKIKDAYREAVMRLSHAAEYKDPETYNHIVRVGLFARLMAERLGLEKEVRDSIMLAAPMHDIGKIGIPDAILLKKGKLNDWEWDVMKKHTIIGYEILKDSSSELLQMAALVALDHHERWDGTGYPNGKKGEEISLWGRITSVADVFDALLSKRPYKEPWSLERTVEHMNSMKGKQFDPQLIELFFSNLEEVVDIREKYKDEEVQSNSGQQDS
ncbi:HD domain-containing phosphohydrolase [Hydrogenivirga sp. 128-5-R1-1]|uniref:HD domain-containing phosphohydrolase n=1 Tax=Hydrogenivirga sp. 128-5-R1-1 TaxID=392423 RepID=UPI00015EF9EA|nr:HD domain-containing phosphohydrolase [Hydrogenivirga sp. 128-5-R1-1]EDP75213.1 response regulator protein-chey-like nd an hd-gyp domain [Hydrogenivirga sp. 128-5-R1-1]